MQFWTLGASMGLLLLVAVPVSGGTESAKELLAKAQKALDGNKAEEAITLTDKAIALDPKNAFTYFLRGQAKDKAGKLEGAVMDFTRVLELDPKAAEAYQARGSAHFKLGHIDASLTDFDKYLDMRPQRRPGHWQRGISLYYVGRFEEGQKQFEAYQGTDANDVENVVWRFLCQARRIGLAKARQDMYPLGKDARVPMKEVYALFKGQAKPDDVLKAANAGNPSSAEQRKEWRFYAHLYLGLYYEAEGNRKAALDELTAAAATPVVGHYMFDVARVHRDLLRQQMQKKENR
jgi:lipoprotein NlpI